MFIEVELRSKEVVYINISHILFVAASKKGSVIFDVTGNDFSTNEPFSELIFRINSILTLKDKVSI